MTRKPALLLPAQLLLILCGIAAAADSFARGHLFDTNAEIYHVDYEEPGLMKNEGVMYGILATYMHRNGIMGRIEGRVTTGEVDYSSLRTGSPEDTKERAFETRGLLGYDLQYNALSLTPYIGFGYRFLDDHSAGIVTTTGHLRHQREFNYYYSPIGIEAVLSLKNRCRIGFMAEYDLFWSGRQESRLSNTVSFPGDMENGQEDGFGVRSSLRLEKDFDNTALRLESFFHWWRIEDSDVMPAFFTGVLTGYGIEPENETMEIGVQISISF